MNKNVIIFILVLFTLLGSIWGSIANRKRIDLELQVKNMTAEMEKFNIQAGKEREQVLGKTAGLQEKLTEKEEQMQKARSELVALRKSTKAIESQLSACTASLQEMNQKNEAYMQEIQAAKKTIAKLEAGGERGKRKQPKVEKKDAPPQEKPSAGEQKDHDEILALQGQLQTTSLTVDQLREELDACNAQIIGMEKLVDEKNAGTEEITQEMDRLKINMDVLLSKIADQRDSLQEMQEENRNLVEELAVKNEEISDLQEKIIQSRNKEE